jgi:hypothetical protein
MNGGAVEPTTWQIVAPWVNRVGMMLIFVSFFFVTQGLLPEDKLRVLEKPIERWLNYFSKNDGFYLLLLVTMILSMITVIGFFSRDTFDADGSLKPIPALSLFITMFLFGALSLLGVVVSRRLLLRMQDDAQVSERWLKIGATLFIVGSAMQLAATLA